MFSKLSKKFTPTDKNYRLKWLFGGYLFSIAFFGWIYQMLYHADHTAFVFANEIYKTQISNQNQADSNLVQKLKIERYYLDSVKNLITLKNVTPDSVFTVYPLNRLKTFRYKINHVFVDFDINEWACYKNIKGEANHDIDINDISGHNNFHSTKYIAMAIDTIDYDPLAVIRQLISKRNAEIDREIAEIKPNTIAKWGWIDFLYFSTITQATVGYGDMLPNSKPVRLVVTFQTLTGVLLSVFLLAYSFENFQNKRRGQNEK